MKKVVIKDIKRKTTIHKSVIKKAAEIAYGLTNSDFKKRVAKKVATPKAA